MRTRFKPYARPELAAWDYFIDKPEEHVKQWKEIFANPDAPLYLELGCGKGSFVAQMAIQNPSINFLGVDIKAEMLVVAKRNIEKYFKEINQMPQNVYLTAYNIENIQTMLSFQDSVSRIYINFCNPWYKSGHAKHRLTHPRQLIQYRKFLKEDGDIYFKTDDFPLFNDSLRYFNMAGFEVITKTNDLHANEPTWNIRTEHENMFSQEGMPIYFCIAKKVPAKLDEKFLSLSKTI